MDSGGVINRHDKGKALYFPFHTLTIKGNAKGRFMVIHQQFLSLEEAVLLSQEFELNFRKEDILYLSSLGLFKAFNNITYVFRGVVDKPIYKINGLKGLYKSCLPTQSIYFSERIEEIIEDEKNFKTKQERVDTYWIRTITPRNDLYKSISVEYSYFDFELYYVDFGYASVAFPSYEKDAKQYDIVKGMVESPLIKNVAERNKPQNAKLLTHLLLKSLDNHYAPNADFDIFFFKITEIANYSFSLEPYFLDHNEMSDQDLMSIYNEHNFDDVFYFECDELIRIFRELSNKNTDNAYDQQIAELRSRIAELETENQNLKKSEPQPIEQQTENYNPTERGTHLQAIAILAMRYAEQNKSTVMTEKGKIKNSAIAEILAKEAKILFTNPKDKDTFRRRLAEALKTYLPQAD